MEEPVTKQTARMDKTKQITIKIRKWKYDTPTYVQSYKQMNNISKRQEAHKSFF